MTKIAKVFLIGVLLGFSLYWTFNNIVEILKFLNEQDTSILIEAERPAHEEETDGLPY